MELSGELSRFLTWANLTREEYLAGHLPALGRDHQYEWEDTLYPNWNDLSAAADGLMDHLKNEPNEDVFDAHLDDLISICCIDWCDGHSIEHLTMTATPERRGKLILHALQVNSYRTHELVFMNPELYFDHEPTKRKIFKYIPCERDSEWVHRALGAWWTWDPESAKDLAGRLSRYGNNEVRTLATRIGKAEFWEKI